MQRNKIEFISKTNSPIIKFAFGVRLRLFAFVDQTGLDFRLGIAAVVVGSGIFDRGGSWRRRHRGRPQDLPLPEAARGPDARPGEDAAPLHSVHQVERAEAAGRLRRAALPVARRVRQGRRRGVQGASADPYARAASQAPRRGREGNTGGAPVTIRTLLL